MKPHALASTALALLVRRKQAHTSLFRPPPPLSQRDVRSTFRGARRSVSRETSTRSPGDVLASAVHTDQASASSSLRSSEPHFTSVHGHRHDVPKHSVACIPHYEQCAPHGTQRLPIRVIPNEPVSRETSAFDSRAPNTCDLGLKPAALSLRLPSQRATPFIAHNTTLLRRSHDTLRGSCLNAPGDLTGALSSQDVSRETSAPDDERLHRSRPSPTKHPPNRSGELMTRFEARLNPP